MLIFKNKNIANKNILQVPWLSLRQVWVKWQGVPKKTCQFRIQGWTRVLQRTGSQYQQQSRIHWRRLLIRWKYRFTTTDNIQKHVFCQQTVNGLSLPPVFKAHHTVSSFTDWWRSIRIKWCFSVLLNDTWTWSQWLGIEPPTSGLGKDPSTIEPCRKVKLRAFAPRMMRRERFEMFKELFMIQSISEKFGRYCHFIACTDRSDIFDYFDCMMLTVPSAQDYKIETMVLQRSDNDPSQTRLFEVTHLISTQ